MLFLQKLNSPPLQDATYPKTHTESCYYMECLEEHMLPSPFQLHSMACLRLEDLKLTATIVLNILASQVNALLNTHYNLEKI